MTCIATKSFDGVDGPHIQPRVITKEVPGPRSKALMDEMKEFMVGFKLILIIMTLFIIAFIDELCLPMVIFDPIIPCSL
jgi:hypothetical protein